MRIIVDSNRQGDDVVLPRRNNAATGSDIRQLPTHIYRKSGNLGLPITVNQIPKTQERSQAGERPPTQMTGRFLSGWLFLPGFPRHMGIRLARYG